MIPLPRLPLLEEGFNYFCGVVGVSGAILLGFCGVDFQNRV
jgi:hypothetical protein